MKEGYIIKSASNSVADKRELNLINNYTRRDYTEDEVYVPLVMVKKEQNNEY